MTTLTISLGQNRHQRGMALVFVMASLVFLTGLLMVFLSSVQLDRQSSNLYAKASQVRLKADSVLNLSMSLVQEATSGQDSSGNTLTWASQPGMIRTFDTKGDLVQAFRLYSWPDMVGDSKFTSSNGAESPPTSWENEPALWTDLNAPQRGIYPILNPDSLNKVNGFNITNAPGSDSSAPVMPVAWLYQLKDGSWVAPTAGSNNTEATVSGATTSNPIVARAAFWTDDETAKININTASEGVFWDSPRWFNPQEINLAFSQPVKHEYQRYPGHPATTSLSPVLAAYSSGLDETVPFEPNLATSSPYLGGYDGQSTLFYLQNLFSLTPRLEWQGSRGGTVAFAYNTAPVTLDNDRLYATVDELAFAAPDNNAKTRNKLEGTNSAQVLDQQTLEELRFFLTASSRAPEVNLFNQPRVTIWPVDDPNRTNPVRTASNDPARALKDQQSPVDKLLAFASTIGSGNSAMPYYFQRSNPTSMTEDLTSHQRNSELYRYLEGFLKQQVPGFGGTFSSKYDQDYQQILTQIVDYIRSSNLLDASGPNPDSTYSADFLYAFTTPPFESGGTSAVNQRHTLAHAGGVNGGPDQTRSRTSTHAASGQVVPLSGPNNTKGFGNYPTISSAAIMFIVSHVSPYDGNNVTSTKPKGDLNYRWDSRTTSDKNGDGKVEPGFDDPQWVRVDANNAAYFGLDPDNPADWGSGVPALPHIYHVFEDELTTSSHDFNGGTGNLYSPFDSMLPGGYVRLQAIFLVNPYYVSPGYPGANPDYKITIEGLEAFNVNTQAMGFPSSASMVVSGDFLGPGGGDDDKTKRFSNYSAMPGIMTTFLGRNLKDVEEGGTEYYPFFATNEITVRGSSSNFSFRGGEITIKIETTGDQYGGTSETVQTIKMDFPDALAMPTPSLPDISGPGMESQINFGRTNGGFNEEKARDWAYAIRHFGHNHDSSSSLRVDTDIASGRNGRFFKSRFDRGWSTLQWADRFILPDHLKVASDTKGSPLDPGKPDHKTGILANPARTADTVQSMEVTHGDVRLVAGRKNVPTSAFTSHPNYGSERSAHSFRKGGFGSLFYGGQPGSLIDQDYYRYMEYKSSNDINIVYDPMVGATIGPGKWPTNWASGGDWDTGLSRSPDGPFINRPEEGSGHGNIAGGEVPYFEGLDDRSYFSAVGANRVSPARLLASPVMFGSLPTGVVANRPWQTLVFSPNPRAGDNHFAFQSGPPDHLILDLFQMPVVEPYAISEPFSTAGKINMNYRLMPFPHITRSTGMRGALKAVKVAAVPTSESTVYKGDEDRSSTATPATANNYRYAVHADETLEAFEDVFDGKVNGKPEVFRSASEITDMFLYPAKQSDPSIAEVNYTPNNTALKSWWGNMGLTGDNMREQPYNALYPRLTTKSNTYTVHMRVQTLKKIPNSSPTVWDETRDRIDGEYIGLATFERFIDPNNPNVPDFATSGGNINDYYQFRIIQTKEFRP